MDAMEDKFQLTNSFCFDASAIVVKKHESIS